MLATEQTLPPIALPVFEVRAAARRLAPAALVAAAGAAGLVLLAGHLPALEHSVRSVLGVSPWWALAAALFEGASLVGYVGLLSLVAGRAAPRVRARESAQIALAGAAATRLLPTAGAGGLALMLWALRRAGLDARAATRSLLVFLVLLYSVFLASLVASGGALALGLAGARGPGALAATFAAGAALALLGCAVLAWHAHGRGGNTPAPRAASGRSRRARVRAASGLLGEALGSAARLAASPDRRLIGAGAYWLLDAGALWAMTRAFGAAPALPVILFAYLVGQVANTLPLPGSVSAGIAGVLIAFSTPAAAALPAVLCYRAIAVWLPTPAALAAVPALRATVARWTREDARAAVARPRAGTVRTWPRPV